MGSRIVYAERSGDFAIRKTMVTTFDIAANQKTEIRIQKYCNSGLEEDRVFKHGQQRYGLSVRSSWIQSRSSESFKKYDAMFFAPMKSQQKMMRKK